MRSRKTFSISQTSAVVFMFILLSACTEQSDTQTISNNHATAVKSIQQTATARKSPSAKHGIVLSSQNVGSYTYIEVDINGQSFWMAASMAVVKPGDKIRWSGYAMMTNFRSKQLNKTFDQIMFVNSVVPFSGQLNGGHTGKIITTMNAAGYSYIEVEEKGSKIWLAAPMTELEEGQTIKWVSGSPMSNFSSKSLGRAFEEIYFVGSVQLAKF